MQQTKKHRSYLKRFLLFLALIFVFITLWYLASRILSPFNAVTSYEVSLTKENEIMPNNATFLIGTYNIAHARGGKYGASNWQKNRTQDDLIQHLDKIAEQLKQSKVDVMVLNEIDFSAAWSFHINQARYLAEKAGFRYVVEQRNMDDSFLFFHFKFGNAILSRYPITNSDLIKFPHASNLENLFVGSHDGVISFMQTPFGKLALIAIHLEYRSEEIRFQSAKQISALAKEYQFPVIAAGDFNSAPANFSGGQKTASGENALSYLLSEGGFQTYIGDDNSPLLNTFPSERPYITIDWVLGHGNLEIVKTEVKKSSISDHFMLISNVNLKKHLVPN
jgi:endonuclease/exonuclease/phosphatase family metal-dependent hydrolase